jgi:hypothetical protein
MRKCGGLCAIKYAFTIPIQPDHRNTVDRNSLLETLLAECFEYSASHPSAGRDGSKSSIQFNLLAVVKISQSDGEFGLKGGRYRRYTNGETDWASIWAPNQA